MSMMARGCSGGRGGRWGGHIHEHPRVFQLNRILTKCRDLNYEHHGKREHEVGSRGSSDSCGAIVHRVIMCPLIWDSLI